MAISPLDIQEIKSKYEGDSVDKKALLDKSFAEVQQKKHSLDIESKINVQKLNESKQKILEVLFGLLKDAGVDLNSIDSINNYLRKLNDINPDFVEMITDMFALADIREEGSTEEPEGEGLMGKFNNLSSQVLRPEEGMMPPDMGEGMMPEVPAIGEEGMMPPDAGMAPPPMSPPIAPQQM
jgi:hypothetical protein